MSRHILHPNLSNNILIYNLEKHDDDTRRSLISDYENGNIIVIRGFDFGLNLDVFDAFDLPPIDDKKLAYQIQKLKEEDFAGFQFEGETADEHLKKTKSDNNIKTSSENSNEVNHNKQIYSGINDYIRYAIFKNDPMLRSSLVSQLQRFRLRVQAFMTEIFSEYEILKSSYACRMYGAYLESLHIDAYENENHFNQVKLFANIDRHPRIWCTGERTDILVDRYYKICELMKYNKLPYTEFLKYVNEALFGKAQKNVNYERSENRKRVKIEKNKSGMSELAIGGLALHSHLFDPGDVWIAETRLVPHQIIHGKKMLSALINTSVSSMLDPKKHIQERLKSIHKNEIMHQ